MSNAALLGFVKELQGSHRRYHRLALVREISNHLFLLSTLGKSSGELSEVDMDHILGRFLIVLQTLENGTTQPPLPAGPEHYAPKNVRNDTRSEAVNFLERELSK